MNIITKKGKNMEKGCRGKIHKIVKGDTLYKLSKKYNVSINEIMNANIVDNVYNLKVGDELCIPVENYWGNNVMYYKVKKGENVLDIVKKTNANICDIFDENRWMYEIVLPENTIVKIPQN